MAKVTYTPTPPLYPQKDEEYSFGNCTVFGITFTPGEPVEVDDKLTIGDAKLNVVGKLRNNGQFTVEDEPKGRKPKAEPAAETADT